MSLADIASDFGAALGVPEPTAQTTYHVAVEPVESTSPTSAFLVAVSADTAPTAGVVRTEKDFELLQSALQTANHDKAFKFGLPKLPPRPRSLFRAGGKSAEQERATDLVVTRGVRTETLQTKVVEEAALAEGGGAGRLEDRVPG